LAHPRPAFERGSVEPAVGDQEQRRHVPPGPTLPRPGPELAELPGRQHDPFRGCLRQPRGVQPRSDRQHDAQARRSEALGLPDRDAGGAAEPFRVELLARPQPYQQRALRLDLAVPGVQHRDVVVATGEVAPADDGADRAPHAGVHLRGGPRRLRLALEPREHEERDPRLDRRRIRDRDADSLHRRAVLQRSRQKGSDPDSAAHRLAMIASANADVDTSRAPSICRARSYVTVRAWIARSSPRTTSAAASSQPMCSSIITPDRISEPGLTLSSPAYLGAVPCVASNSATSSPTLAPGAIPSPPTCAAAASER